MDMEQDPPDPEVPEKKRRRRFTGKYKLRILEEADRCAEPGQIGTLLRREGLYSSRTTINWCPGRSDHPEASDAVRPEVDEDGRSQPKAVGELTDAPLEEDLLHGNNEGETGEAEPGR